MTRPAWDYSDEEWTSLSNQQKADAWDVTAEALKRALDRFDAHGQAAKERWEGLTSSLKEALQAREEHLKKTWGL